MTKVIAFWVIAFYLKLAASMPWENKGINYNRPGFENEFQRPNANNRNVANNNAFSNERFQNIQHPTAPVVPDYIQNIFNEKRTLRIPQLKTQQGENTRVLNTNQYHPQNNYNFESRLPSHTDENFPIQSPQEPQAPQVPQVHYQYNKNTTPRQRVENNVAPPLPQPQVTYPEHQISVENKNFAFNWLQEQIQNLLQLPDVIHIPMDQHPAQSKPIATPPEKILNAYHHALDSYPVYPIAKVLPIPTIPGAVTDAITSTSTAIDSAATAAVAATAVQQHVLVAVHQAALKIAQVIVEGANPPPVAPGATAPALSRRRRDASLPASDPTVIAAFRTVDTVLKEAQDKAKAAQEALQKVQKKLTDTVCALKKVAGAPDATTTPVTSAATGAPTTLATPGIPDAPSTPAIPGAPTTPNIPTVPGTPTTPATPGIPDTPSTPAIPGVPTTPSTPTVPSAPTNSDMHGTPTTPATLTAPGAKTALASPGVPDAPSTRAISSTPTVPGTPTTPATPSIPTKCLNSQPDETDDDDDDYLNN